MWIFFLIPRHTTKPSIVFCLILISATAAQTAGTAILDLEANKYTISLQEAVIKTIKHNPELRIFDSRLKAQQGRVQQAKRAPSPTLSLELEDILGTGNNKGVGNAQATLSIGWVLEHGIRRYYIDAAHTGSSLLEVEARTKKLNVVTETARLYLISLSYQARQLNADRTIQLARDTIQSVNKRVKAGKTPEAELSRAQAELARRKLQRENINYELRLANRRLAAQWGETIPTFTSVEGDITASLQIVSFETLKSRLPQNPEFEFLLSSRLLKKAELRLALAQNKPNWKVYAGIRHANSGNNQAFVAGLSVPFGKHTRNPGRIAEARANLAKTNREERAARVRIETALYIMYEKLQYGLHVIQTVRDEIIPPLEQALSETRRAYNLGRYSYLELRSVQTEMLEAQNTLLEASINAHGNIIEIERLTGVQISQPSTLLKQSNP